MKTRRQLKEENATKQTRSQRSQSKKLTKAEVMKNKQKEKQAKKGKQVGNKKQKKQVSIEVIQKVQIKAQVKVTAKGRKKQKQQRVTSISNVQDNQKQKPSQSKDKKKAKPVKKQTKKGKSKDVKDKNDDNTKKTVKDKSVDVKNNDLKADEDKPRKVPETKKDSEPAKQEKQVVKTVVMKGKVPIDDFFPLPKTQFHVLEHDGKVWSATLNQTNCQHNNNKFYIIQILQSDSNPSHCYFFTRWGRVGSNGQQTNIGVMPIASGIYNYNSKYHQKTRKGQYREIDLNYGNQDENEKKQENNQKKNQSSDQNVEKKQSTLPKPVQSLVELIFDLNMMSKQMVQIGYNVNKMPLGKLSKQSIKKGYGILKQLYQELKKNKRKEVIMSLTNDFYSFIPHDFGFRHMSFFVLDTEEKVKNKIEMLEALAEIKVATTLLSQSKDNMNKIDSNYSKLNRNIEPVDKLTNEFKVINDYLHTTHGKHHTSYSLEIVDLFRVENDAETVRYTKDIDNKMLLWHGSRLTNFVGILSQGLRIAPPEAPVTGYMFGKGVYFADMSSKSANYCFTSRDNNTGILLLCQVALGNMNEKTHADYYASNLPPNKHSTKGIGRIQPDPKNAVELEPGVKIPMGPGIQSNDAGIYLRYNEFIVYDIAQIKVKYLLRTKFNYY